MNTIPSQAGPAPDTIAEARRDLLRLTTAGSVDDGKSTLIGRLLADSGALPADQVEALREAARRDGHDQVDYARLTDGLTAEREQGITIDVAYRYFATESRNFILADVPGHEQYTRNMVTGASNASAALFLVDARHGMSRQTRRHVLVASLMGLRQAVFAINKMDLVAYSEETFRRIAAEVAAFCSRLGFAETHAVPVAAKLGDNVVNPSGAMPWYRGPTVLSLLERLPPTEQPRHLPFRMAVQMASRPQTADARDFRGYMGRIASGNVRVGQPVVIAPGGRRSTVTGILGPHGPAGAATAGQSVTVTLADDIDIGRGFMLGDADAPPKESRKLTALLAWLDDRPLDPRNAYVVRCGTRLVDARITVPERHLDIDTLKEVPAQGGLAMNQLAAVDIQLRQEAAFDDFGDNPATGTLVVIDARTDATVAAGLIEHGL